MSRLASTLREATRCFWDLFDVGRVVYVIDIDAKIKLRKEGENEDWF